MGGMNEWRGLEVPPPYAESMNNKGKSAVSLCWEDVSISQHNTKASIPLSETTTEGLLHCEPTNN